MDFEMTHEQALIVEQVRRFVREEIVPLEAKLDPDASRIEPEYQARVRQNVVLSGGGGLTKGLDRALESALQEIGGGRVRVVEDPVFVGSDGGLAIASDAPEGDWEKLTR